MSLLVNVHITIEVHLRDVHIASETFFRNFGVIKAIFKIMMAASDGARPQALLGIFQNGGSAINPSQGQVSCLFLFLAPKLEFKLLYEGIDENLVMGC